VEFEKSFPKMCKIPVQDTSTDKGLRKKRWRNKQS